MISFFAIFYAFPAALAVWYVVDGCPQTGTVPKNGDPKLDEWVLPEEACTQNRTTATSACLHPEEYGWGDRSAKESAEGSSCGGGVIYAGYVLAFNVLLVIGLTLMFVAESLLRGESLLRAAVLSCAMCHVVCAVLVVAIVAATQVS